MSFLFGLLFGSFGNVVIWRLPRGESLSVPASHCPECDTPIAWYDNVPARVVARAARQVPVVRRARSPSAIRRSSCSQGCCGWPPRSTSAVTAQAAVCIVFFYVLLLLAFIDLDTMRLPNQLVGLLALVGVGGLAVTQFTGVPAVPLMPLGEGLLVDSCGVLAVRGARLGRARAADRAGLLARPRGRGLRHGGHQAARGDRACSSGPYALLVLLLGSVFGAALRSHRVARARRGHASQVPVRPVPRARCGRRDALRGAAR